MAFPRKPDENLDLVGSVTEGCIIIGIYHIITLPKKILQFDWLRGVVFISNSGISSFQEWYFKIIMATVVFLAFEKNGGQIS